MVKINSGDKPERVTIGIQYPTWKKLQALQLEKEIWGHGEAIEFLFEQYENHYSTTPTFKPLTERQREVILGSRKKT